MQVRRYRLGSRKEVGVVIQIQVIDPAIHLFKGNAYSQSLASRLAVWASTVRSEAASESLQAFEQPGYVADEIQSMASGLVSEEGSKSAWRGVYSVAAHEGQMLAICKTNAPGKKNKIVLIVSMPKAQRKSWPNPSPVSCLIAEVAYRSKGAPVYLDAEVPELIGFYERYGFKTTGGGGQKAEMKLDTEDAGKLIGKYKFGVHWRYARPLPPLPDCHL
jgi:hypothetical protein